jgi:hypothetical protein
MQNQSVTRIRRRASAVGAGVLLVLVPTLFTVFPAWSKWTLALKLLVLCTWLLAALFVVYAGASETEQVLDLLGTVRRRWDHGRRAAGRFILRALMRPEIAGFPDHYEFRLFLPDPTGARLIPEYESQGQSASPGWAIGQGATGTAWASRSYVRVRGDAVSDGTYGLTREQQQHARTLKVVAAAPVLNARVEPVAVLSVSSSDDDGFLFDGDGPQRHAELAEVAARVLIDIFAIGRD